MVTSKIFPYENKLVAFVDLLGFKKAIFESESDTNIKKSVDKAIYSYLQLKTLNDLHTQLVKEKGINKGLYDIAFFSDCFVISCKKQSDKQKNLYIDFFKGLVNISFKLLSIGFLIRGGVTYGLLYHQDNMIYGPAMNRAYLLESQQAKYPRILVDGYALQEISKDEHSREIMQYISPDKTDGMMFIDYLSQEEYFEENDNYWNCNNERLTYGQLFSQAKDQIEMSIETFKEQNKVLDKFNWFKDYHNNTVLKSESLKNNKDKYLIK